MDMIKGLWNASNLAGKCLIIVPAFIFWGCAAALAVSWLLRCVF